MTTNPRLNAAFSDVAPQASAQIIVLHPATRISNEELRQRQYLAQRAMLDAAVKAANERGIILPDMLKVQHQPVCEISATQAEQAAMQGEKGFAFKL